MGIKTFQIKQESRIDFEIIEPDNKVLHLRDGGIECVSSCVAKVPNEDTGVIEQYDYWNHIFIPKAQVCYIEMFYSNNSMAYCIVIKSSADGFALWFSDKTEGGRMLQEIKNWLLQP